MGGYYPGRRLAPASPARTGVAGAAAARSGHQGAGRAAPAADLLDQVPAQQEQFPQQRIDRVHSGAGRLPGGSGRNLHQWAAGTLIPTAKG
jgi:hypothetical protein